MKEIEARGWDGIAKAKGDIPMASGMPRIELGESEDVKRVSLRLKAYRDAISTASEIPSRKLCDVEDIQTATLRQREYR